MAQATENLVNEIWCDTGIVTLRRKYEVSNIGRVRSITHLTKLVYILSKNACSSKRRNHPGYYTVSAGRSNHNPKLPKKVYVHHLVAKAFLEEPPTTAYEINHKDGNPLNNYATNLEWVTRSEQIWHAWNSINSYDHIKKRSQAKRKAIEDRKIEVKECKYRKLANLPPVPTNYDARIVYIANLLRDLTLTYGEIACVMGLTRQRIGQIAITYGLHRYKS